MNELPPISCREIEGNCYWYVLKQYIGPCPIHQRKLYDPEARKNGYIKTRNTVFKIKNPEFVELFA